MKECLCNINRIYLLAIAGIQSVCAIVWLIMKIGDGSISVLSLFSMIILVSVLGLLIFKKNKMWLLAVVFVLTMPQVLDTAVSAGHLAGLPDAPKGNVSQLMVQRFAWPYVSEMAYTYYLDLIDDAEVIRLSMSPEKMWDTFFPTMDGYFGIFAPEVYSKFTKTALQTYKTKILPATVGDFFSYYFSPVTTELNSRGIGLNNNGNNFNVFTNGTGAFGRFYFHFGFAAFAGLVVLSVISMAVNKSLPKGKIVLGMLVLNGIIATYDIICPLRGFDYRNGVLITLIWSFFLIYAMRDVNADC